MGRPNPQENQNYSPTTKHNNPTFNADQTQIPSAGYPPVYNNNAGVPMGRPVGQVGTGQQNWSSDLFDCMNDPENALITCCFPFVTFGQIAEVVDQGATSCGTGGTLYGVICCLIGIPCVYSCSFRAKMRNKFGLVESPASDWITHCFCEYCALCQEYRELKHQGLDPAIGWIGNMQRQQMAQQQEMMAPPTGQRMMG